MLSPSSCLPIAMFISLLDSDYFSSSKVILKGHASGYCIFETESATCPKEPDWEVLAFSKHFKSYVFFELVASRTLERRRVERLICT